MVLSIFFLGSLSAAAAAQLPSNPPYDGRAVLARLRYTPLTFPNVCQDADGTAGPPGGWGHDYPISVQSLMRAATELTSLEAPVDSVVTLKADDPLLLKYPVVMVTEPGCWDPTEAEVQALRTYVRKGGFLLVDDPTFSDASPEHCKLAIERFEKWMKRVLPEGQLMRLPVANPVFTGFFAIDPDNIPPIFPGGEQPEVWGIYQDNDPAQRLMVVANYNNALGHFWRWRGKSTGSGLGQDNSNVAYKLGLNFFLYGLSH